MKVDSVSSLGLAIKKRRGQLGITQEDLSEISGTSLRSLKALEKGTANPTWRQISKVLHALGWTLELKDIRE